MLRRREYKKSALLILVLPFILIAGPVWVGVCGTFFACLQLDIVKASREQREVARFYYGGETYGEKEII